MSDSDLGKLNRYMGGTDDAAQFTTPADGSADKNTFTNVYISYYHWTSHLGELRPGNWLVWRDSNSWDMEIHFMCPHGHIWKSHQLRGMMRVRCANAYPDCDFDALVDLRT